MIFFKLLKMTTTRRTSTPMLTFDPKVASPAPEVMAFWVSVTIIGDLELAAGLDMGGSILQLRGE